MHYDESRAQLKDGDLIVMDMGAEFGYYSADLTRTIPASGRFSNRQRHEYANEYTDSDSNAYASAYRDLYSYTQTDSDSHTFRHAYPCPYRDAHSFGYAYGHSHLDPYAFTDRHAHTHRHSDRHCYQSSGDACPNSDCHAPPNHHPPAGGNRK